MDMTTAIFLPYSSLDHLDPRSLRQIQLRPILVYGRWATPGRQPCTTWRHNQDGNGPSPTGRSTTTDKSASLVGSAPVQPGDHPSLETTFPETGPQQGFPKPIPIPNLPQYSPEETQRRRVLSPSRGFTSEAIGASSGPAIIPFAASSSRRR